MLHRRLYFLSFLLVIALTNAALNRSVQATVALHWDSYAGQESATHLRSKKNATLRVQVSTSASNSCARTLLPS